MRMWMVPPAILCRKHLLGEHVELHMFAGHFRLGRKMGKYSSLCEPEKIESRHSDLVAEMEARGYDHASPLSFTYKGSEPGSVDSAASLDELLRRCPECRKRFKATKIIAK